jgi:hypothetical protein
MKTFDLTKAPSGFETWSVDEVAECVDGITPATYDELWQALAEAEKAGTDKPPGGDGSDGTTEEPIVTSGEYGSDLVAAWPRLSLEARTNIHECYERRESAFH